MELRMLTSQSVEYNKDEKFCLLSKSFYFNKRVSLVDHPNFLKFSGFELSNRTGNFDHYHNPPFLKFRSFSISCITDELFIMNLDL